jgi:hypothetical protein
MRQQADPAAKFFGYGAFRRACWFGGERNPFVGRQCAIACPNPSSKRIHELLPWK